jgi:hypothetical protein
MKKIYILFILVVFTGFNGFSQLDPSGEELELPGFFDNFSIGGLGGISLFHGDLANYYLFPKKEDRRNAIQYGYKLYVEKDIWKGLGARLMFSKGRLGGGAQKGLQSHYMNFRSDYFDITLQAKFRLSDYIFRKASDSRFFIHGYFGYGIIGFRSLEWYRATGLVRNYVGYDQTAESGESYTKILESKGKRKIKQVFPVGVKFGYQISSKADLIFEYSLNNARTDQMDTWVREWTADDKYGFFGLGLQITFNRDSEALEPLFKRKEKKDKQANGKKGDGPSNQEVLNAALKILEIQLKLFEMNYLNPEGKQ